MIIKRPSIFIYTHEADPTVVKDVCAGIEEEGIFYDVTEMPDTCMEKLAYKAARDSMLGSGVGHLRHRRMPEDARTGERPQYRELSRTHPGAVPLRGLQQRAGDQETAL